MSIDLDTSEGRKQYLSEKLDDLLDGINNCYGTVLMEELLCRLELTIKDFNDEMKTLCNQLVKKQEERQHLLEILKSRENISLKKVSGTNIQSDDNDLLQITTAEKSDKEKYLTADEEFEDIPIWEKKLAQLEKK